MLILCGVPVFAYMHVHIPCLCMIPKKPEESVGSPGPSATGLMGYHVRAGRTL